MAAGLLGAAVASRFVVWQATVMVGWLAAGTAFLVRVWVRIWPFDAEATDRHATELDDSRVVADLSVLVACVASLVSVALLLAKASLVTGGLKRVYIGIAVGSVVVSWTVVHTVFSLRYGHLYYDGEDGGIDFPGRDLPTYRDFAYLAFTVGMTYQVSDTNLTSPVIRAAALRHALLSFLFGTTIIAMTISLVAAYAFT
ncbi:MAG: hypothetical protein QOF60_833 [Actinomycetota bacterium]|nr:hypothetical protein [Actinomycetota bacterium]